MRQIPLTQAVRIALMVHCREMQYCFESRFGQNDDTATTYKARRDALLRGQRLAWGDTWLTDSFAAICQEFRVTPDEYDQLKAALFTLSPE